jgi:hypothetical protein
MGHFEIATGAHTLCAIEAAPAPERHPTMILAALHDLALAGRAPALADAFACVPLDALPVVTTTWALSHFPLESRLRFLHRLDAAAAGRAVAWVSAEEVGVAPTIPTLGDREPLATASSAWRCSTGRLRA